jgi:hypothetical protein
MLVISALRKLRQVDPKFEATLSYLWRSCLGKKKNYGTGETVHILYI